MGDPSLVSEETLQAIWNEGEISPLEDCEQTQSDTQANLPPSHTSSSLSRKPQFMSKEEAMKQHLANNNHVAGDTTPVVNEPATTKRKLVAGKSDTDTPSTKKLKSDTSESATDKLATIPDVDSDDKKKKLQRITANANDARSLRKIPAGIANKIKAQLKNLLSLVGSIFNLEPDNKDSRYATQDLPYLMKDGIDPGKIADAFKFVAENYPNDTKLCDQFNMISSSCLKLLKVHGKIVEEKKALETKNLKLGKMLMQIADGNIKVFNTAIINVNVLNGIEIYTDPKLTKCIETLEDKIKSLENPKEEE